MVRVNIIDPRKLADQHLIAEYDEILMLLGHAKKHPQIRGKPKNYCLGEGHINFFKDKLLYLKKRHELIKKEMRRRGFAANKTISLRGFDRKLLNDWKPNKEDFTVIKRRLIWKIKKKPHYYRYYRKYKPKPYFIQLLKT